MEKISKFSLSKLIFSILFNGAILALALLVFIPFFEELDDTNIAMIVEGAFGIKEWHVIYPNVIIGKLYVLLQTLFGNVRWHIILQYAFIYIAYVSLTYVISKHKRGLFVSIVAVLATFYEMYVSIQYTKTAAFVAAAGYMLIFEYVRNVSNYNSLNNRIISNNSKSKSKENKVFLFVAVILIVYGALLRPESIFIAAVPALSVGILELVRTKNIKKYLIVFLPVFASVVLLNLFNSYVYSTDETWSHFMEYNKARMELNDYRYDIFDFIKYKDILEDLNVSENDAFAILTYQYADDDIFSADRFKEIRAPFPRREFGYVTFANLYENLVNELKRDYTLLLGLFGLVLVLIASIVTDRSKSSPGFIKDANRKMFCLLFMGICCFAAVVYFQYSGRFSHRLLGAIVIPTIFFIDYMIDSIYIKDNDSKIVFGGNKNDVTVAVGLVLSIILIGLNGLLYMGNISDYGSWVSENHAKREMLADIEKDKESLYVGDTFTFQNVYKYDVFNTFKEGELDNFVTTGSWYVNSPLTKNITKKYGYDNPYKALREGNAYLLDNTSPECKTLFMQEHYDKIYRLELLEKRNEIDVYQVVKDQDKD